MTKICDRKCVGQIIRRHSYTLCIVRRNYPRAFALPAGHVDGDSSFEAAAVRETKEETDIDIRSNRLVWSGILLNPCRREEGIYHDWRVYRADSWAGEPNPGDDAKTTFWASPEKLQALAKRTEYFIERRHLRPDLVGEVSASIFGSPNAGHTNPEWVAEMGLEPVWYFILKQVGLL